MIVRKRSAVLMGTGVLSALVLGVTGCTGPREASPDPTPTAPFEGITEPSPRDLVPAGAIEVPRRLPSAVEERVIGEPFEFLRDGEGLTVGHGTDGTFVVAHSPIPDDMDPMELYTTRSGLGLWRPGGDIEWVIPVPDEPVQGPAVFEAAISDDWLVWLENDSNHLDHWPFWMWVMPLEGGERRLVAESEALYEDRHIAPPGWYRSPLILGDVVYWVDMVQVADGTLDIAIMFAPLADDGPAEVRVQSGWGLRRDPCGAEGELAFLYLVGDFDAADPVQVHRVVVDRVGSVVSETVVWTDPRPSDETLSDVAVCGSTTAVLRRTPEESATEFDAWIEIDTGDRLVSYRWPRGSGSVLTTLHVTPDVVAWAAYNGDYEGSRYVFDLDGESLYQLPTAPGLSRVYADERVIQWSEDGDGADDVPISMVAWADPAATH